MPGSTVVGNSVVTRNNSSTAMLLRVSANYSFRSLLKERMPTRRKGISKYKYKDIIYIVDERGREVTSYAKPVKLDQVPISKEMKDSHREATHVITTDKSKWTSNTVIVVDTSGSMRKADVFETRTRLDSVWLCLALDFVAPR